MKEIIESIDKLAKLEGVNSTLLPGVKVYRSSKSTPVAPLVYNQGIIFLAQGTKKVYLGNTTYEYNNENYLVLTVPLPLKCEAIVSNDLPLLGIIIDIEIGVLNNIINTMGDDIIHQNLGTSKKSTGLFTAKTNDQFLSTIQRLLKSLENTTEVKMLGRDLIKELIYRIMCGENASSLYCLAMKNTKISKIEMALKEIHGNYQSNMDVEKLASLANMSLSSFHHTFKEVTASSPIQYLKKVRLSKAKEILIEEDVRVNEAARLVGYESVTQFSREFKRYFGHTAGSL